MATSPQKGYDANRQKRVLARQAEEERKRFNEDSDDGDFQANEAQ